MKQAIAANDYLVEDTAKEKTIRNILGEDIDNLPGQMDMLTAFDSKIDNTKEDEQS
jgi:hypothetical protein